MKKKIIFIIVLLILVSIAITLLSFYKDKKTKNEIEKSESINPQFKISKIQCYSDVSATKNNTTYQNPEWNLNLYQYTDIAIYFERLEEYDYKNYIKEMYINNIKIVETKKGKNTLFYLNPLNFGKPDFDVESNFKQSNLEKLEYNIINSDNKENDISYSIPIFFEDLSTPITFRYLNYDIVKNFTIDNTENVNFNGSLLKRAKVDLVDIDSEIYMDINIITKDDKKHITTLNLDIPLENIENTIYDCGIELIKENPNIEF